MQIDLGGKTALVTGSTGGIGFAATPGLAAAGAEMIVNGLTARKVDAAVARIGHTARGIAADLATAEGFDVLVRPLPAADIVVSNLGIFQPTSSIPTMLGEIDTGRSE